VQIMNYNVKDQRHVVLPCSALCTGLNVTFYMLCLRMTSQNMQHSARLWNIKQRLCRQKIYSCIK
jgi:hypothetical protein